MHFFSMLELRQCWVQFRTPSLLSHPHCHKYLQRLTSTGVNYSFIYSVTTVMIMVVFENVKK